MLIALAAATIGLGCVVAQSRAAFADTITVTTTEDELDDNGNCSLREAVQAANTDSATGGCPAGSGADLISVPAGTYTLTIAAAGADDNTSGDLNIEATLVISGAGSAQTIIDANGIDRALASSPGSYTVTLRELTVQHGAAEHGGGAIFFTDAELLSVRFFSNTAQSMGGAAYFAGHAIVVNSQFENNTATNLGGGAYAHGSATVSGSTFTENYAANGGGLLIAQTAHITQTEFTSNTAFAGAGAQFRGPTTVSSSSFAGNVATGEGGGATFWLTSTVTSSHFDRNSASYNTAAVFYGAVDVSDTRFFSNTSAYSVAGSAFYEASTIRHSVFEANTSTNGDAGAAIFLGATTIESTDFLYNSARYLTGGALFLGDHNSVADSRFIGNVSIESGGGICTAAGIAHCISAGGRQRIGADFIQPGSVGGAFFNRATTVTRTVFLSNTAPDVGGATFYGAALVVDSSFQANTGTNTSCSTLCAGGAYFADTSTVAGSVFASNRTTNGAGGARFVLTTTVAQTDFYSNTAEAIAGGAAFDSAASLRAVTFTSNTTRYGAGGAYFAHDGVSVIDAQFVDNHAFGRDGAPCPSVNKVVCTSLLGNTKAGATNSPGITTGGAHFDASAATTRARFSGNTAQGVGGARFLGSAQVVDSTFSDNHSTGSMEPQHGGGAYFQSAAIVTGTSFERNSATQNGGGARFVNSAEIADSVFAGNTTTNSFGGGAHFGGETRVSATAFTNNSAENSGGGAYFEGQGNVIDSAAFAGNISKTGGGGGALFVYTTTVRGTQFISNTAWIDGGAMFASQADLANTEFVSNTATGFGAGGASFGAAASLSATRFIANSTARSGGGASFSASATITNSLFINNHALLDGGGVNIDGGSFTGWFWEPSRGNVRMVNTLFAGNTAGNNGAALYVHDSGGLHLLHVTIGSSQLQPNQAIAVHAGTVFVTNTIIASHTIGIERSAGAVSEDYTLFSSVVTPRRGSFAAGAHSRVGNAAFADPAASNYHLTARSDALNRGVDAGLEHDIDGQLRRQGHGRGSDIGFDEFVQWIQILTMVSKT